MKLNFFLLTLFLISISTNFALAAETVNLPRPNTVTMIDLGAKSCIPCKMMAPILEKLSKEYEGRADVVFIDVRDNPGEGQKYGISAIPTQIFFNKKGEEAARHEGFLSEEDIKIVLDQLLQE